MGLRDLVAFALGSNTPGAIQERRELKEQLEQQLREMQRATDPRAGEPLAGKCPGCAQAIEPRATYCRFCGREAARSST